MHLATETDKPPTIMQTTIVPINVARLGRLCVKSHPGDILDELHVQLGDTPDAEQIKLAAEQIRTTSIPVAFPTETVYGLGADATRSDAVKGIFAAKQRPSDNPLIVHFASLQQLRSIFEPSTATDDPIPSIYYPLIRRFWPGPLTIILPTPTNTILAPEVTAGLKTFGARIPRHPIALTLIRLARVPIAAPSANASTKPSPTAAEHVATDLDGRIATIIDGGPCAVGVESTVVDGLTDPPSILRPGGISIDQLRACPGWEYVAIAYHDAAQQGSKPRAPGMKYRHYSPRAPVILYENGQTPPDWNAFDGQQGSSNAIGLLRTRTWKIDHLSPPTIITAQASPSMNGQNQTIGSDGQGFAGLLDALDTEAQQLKIQRLTCRHGDKTLSIHDIELGHSAEDIARGIFGGLRALDQYNVDAIFVEGIDDATDDLAAAVMNRLRKAAEKTVSVDQ